LEIAEKGLKKWGMTSWKITLTVARNLIPLTEEIIYGLDQNDFPTLSDFEIAGERDLRLLEAFFTVKPDLELLRKKLGNIAPPLGINLEIMAEKDWVSESQKLLQPVDSGLFFVYGAHDTDKVPPDRISLLVEAGQAFGTGQHETTYGCLLAIGDLRQEFQDYNMPGTALDLGCGSGVLALAMSKIWPITIVASDIDRIATDTTRLNAGANQVAIVPPRSGESGLAIVTSNAFADSDLTGPYDVIVANILAGPLQDMAPDIAKNLSVKGSLILSGLLATQQDMVAAAYTREGLSVIRRYIRGEWSSLMLRRTEP